MIINGVQLPDPDTADVLFMEKLEREQDAVTNWDENPEIKTRIGSIPDDIFYFPSATLEDMKKYYKGIYPSFDDALFEKLYEAFQLPKKRNIFSFHFQTSSFIFLISELSHFGCSAATANALPRRFTDPMALA
jgi:hypothetical protein